VQSPFRESLIAGRGEVTARFSGNASLQIIAGVQRNQITGVLSPNLIVLLSLKPVF
jgi:hypothetical protein